ncbi:MAG: hypothetical protein ABS48_01545 [Erythrobacter sp. SCN 68-10]|nr:MAG: hypothetical protein ABS48_01545 [Erythrobacter sp. SCN 68-10]
MSNFVTSTIASTPSSPAICRERDGDGGEQRARLAPVAGFEMGHRGQFAGAAEERVAGRREILEPGDHVGGPKPVERHRDFAHARQIAQRLRRVAVGCDGGEELGRLRLVARLERGARLDEARRRTRGRTAFGDERRDGFAGAAEIVGTGQIERADDGFRLRFHPAFAVAVPPQVAAQPDEARDHHAENRRAIPARKAGGIVLPHGVVDLADQDIVLVRGLASRAAAGKGR